MQHGVAYEDIYNFDETGFAMGLIATAKVVTRLLVVLLFYSLGIVNGSQQLNVLMLWVGYCLHASSSKERAISRPGMKMMLCHMIEGLTLVRMNGQHIKFVFPGFRISSPQLQMAV